MRKINKLLTLILTMVMILTITYHPIEASAKSAKPVVKASKTVISKGTKTNVKVTYGKKNVTSKAKFKTSNKKVATVSKKGVVTGKKAGTAYITATYKGRTSKKVKITVAQLSLSKTSLKLTAGKTATLTAKYNKKKVRPSFRTSNAAVASVNKSGKITAKKKGTATITATYKKSKVSCKVTISKTETGCASGHAYNNGIITKQPTCSEGGIKTYTCTRCGEIRTEAVAKLGHSWDKGTMTIPPTADADGTMTYTCTRCHETKTEPYTEKIWDEEVTEDAAVCNGCGKVFSVAEYGSGDAAGTAAAEHVGLADWDSNCDSYHTEVCTFTLRHDATTGKVWVVQ